MNKELPLVSVIIPTYKRSSMLPRAIDSVLSQTYPKVQIVVVDDNDPDSEWRKTTSKLMENYSTDKRIKYVCHPKNMNGSVARNTGISESDGEIVTFLDDDDLYVPEKIEKQVSFLLDHPQYHAVYCGRDIDEKIPQKQGDLSLELLSGSSLVYTITIMMWKKDAMESGWDETFRRNQEAAFMLRYFKNGQIIGVVPERLCNVDISDRSNAAQSGKVNEKYMTQYLSTFSDVIDDLEKKKKGSKKFIYSYRYRGMLFDYIYHHEYKEALGLYFRVCKHIPFKFTYDIVTYSFNYFFKKLTK